MNNHIKNCFFFKAVSLPLILFSSISVFAQTSEFPQEEEHCDTFFDQETQQEFRNCSTDQTGSSTSQQTTDFVGILSDIISLARAGFDLAGSSWVTSNTGMLGGAAGSDMGDSGKLSSYAAVNYSDTERRATDIGLGYEQDNEALVLGVDYRLRDNLITGATFSYLDTETDFDDNPSSNDNKTYLLGFYASQYWNNAFLDVMLTYGQVDIETERVAFGTFEGDTDGDFHSAEINAGLNHSYGRLRLTPSLRLLHVRGELDGYTETTSSAFATPITYDDQPFESLNARAALQLDYALLMDWGVLIPSLNLAYHHEYIGAEKVTTTTPFGFTTQQTPDAPEKNYKAGRLGLSAQFQGGLAAFFSYERLMDHFLLDRDNFSLGVRYELP